MSYPYGNTRDASDVIYRNDYRTRYIGWYGAEQNTISAIVHIDDGSAAVDQASEYTYLTIGRAMLTGEEFQALFGKPVVIPILPKSIVYSLYYNITAPPYATTVFPDGALYMVNGSSNIYTLSGNSNIIFSTGIPTTPTPSFTSITYYNSNLYIVDTANSKIYVGSNEYTGSNAPFADMGISSLVYPTKIQVSATSIYYLEQGASTIKMSANTVGSMATIVAGSTPGFLDGNPAQFNNPLGFVLDAAGTNLYIADTDNSLIRQMSTTTNTVTTLAGNITEFFNPYPTDNVGNKDGIGVHGDTLLYHPNDITMGNNILYIADTGNNNIRQLTVDGTLSTIGGLPGSNPIYDMSPKAYLDGFATESLWNAPSGITCAKNLLFISEPLNSAVRIITIV